MMKKLSLIVTLIAASLLLSACGASSTPAAAAQPEAAAQPAALIAEGRLMPANSLEQSFSLPGQVAEVLVKDGEAVKAGQALARLSSAPEANSALARAQQELLAAQQALNALSTNAGATLANANVARIAAQAAMDDAQTRYDADKSEENQALLDQASAVLAQAKDTYQKLQSGKGIDPDVKAAAEARLAAAQSSLDSAQAALDALELRSNLDGTVVDLELQPGQRIIAGQPVMMVADLSAWLVKTDNLTEAEVVNVKQGQSVTVVLDALPDVTLQGEVTHINARYEEKRGDITYTVTIALSQTDPAMRWGMTAAVTFAR